MTIHEGLKRTRTILERGWAKGSFGLGGEFCIVGATRFAFTDSPYVDNRDTHAARAIFVKCRDELFPAHANDGGSMTGWNDAPTTTKDDVLAVVDCAIAKSA